MKNWIKSRGFLAVTFLTMGIVIGALGMKAYDESQRAKLVAQNPMARFFGMAPTSPFSQLQQQMQDQMEDAEESIWSGLFNSRIGGGLNTAAIKLSENEDEKFRYYELAVPDLSPDKVDIRVEEGQLEISGKIEKKTEAADGSSIMSTTFHRSFSVPDDVESDKVLVEQKKDSIVIKFPKTGARN